VLVEIDFSGFPLKTQDKDGQVVVFDILRKKNVVLSPEEMVRQKLIHYLIHEKQYPRSMIKVESGLKYFNQPRRSDILVYDSSGKVYLIVECKSFKESLGQQALDQVAMYNRNFKSRYIMVTNGKNSIVCQMEYDNNKFHFLRDVPNFTNG